MGTSPKVIGAVLCMAISHPPMRYTHIAPSATTAMVDPRTRLVMVARGSSNRRLREEPLGFFLRAFGVFAVFVSAMGERCQAKEGVGQGDA